MFTLDCSHLFPQVPVKMRGYLIFTLDCSHLSPQVPVMMMGYLVSRKTYPLSEYAVAFLITGGVFLFKCARLPYIYLPIYLSYCIYLCIYMSIC